MSGNSNLYHRRQALYKVRFPIVVIIVSILPAFAMIFAVVWSVLFNFQESTRSHCQAYNFLPSISAAIGDYTPKYVWRICIALHCGPRFLMAVSYYGYHTSIYTGRHDEIYKSLAALSSFLNLVEVSALVGLSYISSSEDFGVHKFFFCLFMFCSEFYMILTCCLIYKIRTYNDREMTSRESCSLCLKKKLCVFNITVFILALCFYFHHNNYCTDRIYSYFALCEYCVILSNIGFHATAVLDFKSTHVLVQEPSLVRSPDSLL